MKAAAIFLALCSSIVIWAVAGFEYLFEYQGPFYETRVWNNRLELACICCCIWAFWRTISATVVASGAILLRLAIGLLVGLPGHRLDGFMRYAVVTVAFMLVAVWIEERNAAKSTDQLVAAPN